VAQWPLPKLPDARTLYGRYVRLERLSGHHGDDLWESFSADPRHYDYLYQGPFRTKREFDEWFTERLQRMDYHQYWYIVISNLYLKDKLQTQDSIISNDLLTHLLAL
jgi:hypothetical protein